MTKRMSFSNPSTREVFAQRDLNEFVRLTVDTATNQIKSNYSADEANDGIREVFNEVLGISEDTSKKELRKAIRRHKIDIYEIIEEIVPNLLETGWINTDFFDKFVEYKNLDAGDTNEFYVKDEVILTVSEISGGHHNLIRQRLGEGQTFSVKISHYGVKIYAEFEHFMSGKIDWATFVQKIYQAFDYKMNGMLHEAIMSAGDKVLPTSQFTKTLQLVSANKDEIIELADDVGLANGCEVVFMGTKAALAKLSSIQDVNWISNDMKNERHTTGRLGVWEGYGLYEIPQAFGLNDTTKKLVDNNKLLVMPLTDNKFIKVVNEGSAQFFENTDSNKNRDMTMEAEYQQKMGVATVINRKFGQIKIAE